MVLRLVITCGLVTSVSGCGENGPRQMRVWGEVRFDGVPVEAGRIIFTPTGDTPGGSTGGALTRGKYDIPSKNGPYAGGTYRVEISSLAGSGKTVAAIGLPSGSRVEVFKEAIPAIYNVSSTLSVTISADSSKNQFDFPLKRVETSKTALGKRR